MCRSSAETSPLRWSWLRSCWAARPPSGERVRGACRAPPPVGPGASAPGHGRGSGRDGGGGGSPRRDDVLAARGTIAGRVHRMPMFTSATLGERIGAGTLLKAELFQKTGSFKPRGVLNELASLTAEEKERGVVTWSAGISPGGRLGGGERRASTAWSSCPPGRTRAGGGDTRVRRHVDLEAPEQAAATSGCCRSSRRQGAPHPPFDDPQVIAGQGTVGLEIAEDVPDAGPDRLPDRRRRPGRRDRDGGRTPASSGLSPSSLPRSPPGWRTGRASTSSSSRRPRTALRRPSQAS